MNKDQIVVIVVATLLLYFVYDFYLSDLIKDKLDKSRTKKLTIDKFEKIAQIKLISDDSKEIEKFICDNTEHLSTETVQKLVDRMEVIKSDRIIGNDSLKTRIDSLVENEEEPTVAKRAARKR